MKNGTILVGIFKATILKSLKNEEIIVKISPPITGDGIQNLSKNSTLFFIKSPNK